MPFIYLVQREDFPAHAEEGEEHLSIIGCYTTAHDASRFAHAAAKRIYNDCSDPSLADAPKEDKDTEFYSTDVYVYEADPGPEHVLVSVVKRFCSDSYESEDEAGDDTEGEFGEDEEEDEAEDNYGEEVAPAPAAPSWTSRPSNQPSTEGISGALPKREIGSEFGDERGGKRPRMS